MASTVSSASVRPVQADENMAPPISGKQNSGESDAASTSTATTSRVPNAGLMLEKLNHIIRCLADGDSTGGTAATPATRGEASTAADDGNSTGPQTRYRGRAEKLKSRWMNMVLTSSPGKANQNDFSLPPPPAVRDVPQPVFPEGHKPEFELIAENEYLTNNVSGSARSRRAEKQMTCECTFTPQMAAEGRLGCTSPTECFNRMLYVECGSRCVAGDYCANKRFQRHEYAPLELFDAEAKGLGVRAKSPIQSGDFLLEYVGEVIDFDQFRSRLKRYSKAGRKHWFFMALSSEQYLDATLKGNISRYMNHSCDPNAEMQKWTVNGQIRIGFFARRRIEPGEEVTLDYQFETYGEKVQTCLCGAANCRGYIGKLVAPVGTLTNVHEGVSSDEEDDQQRVRMIGTDRKAVELGDKIEKLAADPAYLRTSPGLLDLCRLMVRAESREHRASLVALLSNQVAESSRNSKGFNLDQFSGDFIRLHGLEVLWSWLVEEERGSPRSNSSETEPHATLSLRILQFLDEIPMLNRNVLDESQLFSFVERLTTSNEVDEVKLAQQLLAKWSTLKLLFRIPRVVVSQSSRVQSGFNKQQQSEISPISSATSAAGSIWASSISTSRFSRSFINGRGRPPINHSRYHWGKDGVENGSVSKEERRKQFEQAMIEEERMKRQQMEEEEEARRLNNQVVEDASSTPSLPDLQSESMVSNEDEDQEAAGIASLIADFGLDLTTIFGEISQLLADPLMADINATANNEHDSEQLIARLSSFPQITRLISLLSSDGSEPNDTKQNGESEPAEEPQLPPGWSSAVDAESGKTYYYNRITNKTQWEMPMTNCSTISPSSDSNGSSGAKKRVSMSVGDTAAKQRKVEQKKKRNHPCEIHNVFDDCSPYLDDDTGSGEVGTNSNSPNSVSSPAVNDSQKDKSFKCDLGKYIAKLLKPYYCKDQTPADESGKGLIRSSQEFKDICRKWTESIYSKERARTKHHLELNEAIQGKVQSFVDKYIESMRRKQQNHR